MTKQCECCNNDYQTYKKSRRYCSRECAQCYKRQEKQIKECEFTGCTNTFTHLSASKQKFCSKDCQINWQRYHQLGERNGNYGRENKWGEHSDEVRNDIRLKIIKSWEIPERVEKQRDYITKFKMINGYEPMHSPEAREKRSEANVLRNLKDGHLTTYKTCKTGYYFNIKNNVNEYYHSSWEEIRMEELDTDLNVLNWTKQHGIIIKYFHDGIIKSYWPDFLITYKDGRTCIEEVKGYIDNIDIFLLKKAAAEEYCKATAYEFKINLMKNYNKYKHLL